MLDRISRFSYIKYLSTLNFTKWCVRVSVCACIEGLLDSTNQGCCCHITFFFGRFLFSSHFCSFRYGWSWFLLFLGHFLHLHFYFAYWEILSQIMCSYTCFVWIFSLILTWAFFFGGKFLFRLLLFFCFVWFCFVVD